MKSAVLEITNETELDISNLNIHSHAMGKYITVCYPGLSLIKACEQMRERLKSVQRVSLRKNMHSERVSYVDKYGTIYIASKNTVITVYPNERIFVSNPISKRKGKRFR